MKKALKSLLSLIFVLSLLVSATGCSSNDNGGSDTTVDGTYSLVQNVYSWGSSYSKVIIPVNFKSGTSYVDPGDYAVSVVRYNKNGELLNTGNRVVSAAYRSNENGVNDDNGNYITLDLAVTANLSLAQPYYTDPESFSSGLKAWADCQYTVTNTETNEVWDTLNTVYHPDEEKFTTDSFTASDNTTVPYALYEVNDGEEHPLIVWLHGAGSGGTDIGFVTGGMLVTNFVTDDVQEIFGGANILLPQCETVWMDDGTGAYTSDGTSGYSTALIELIQEIITTKNVDPSKVYLGGCSNGGYMTIRLAMDNPDVFAAIFPVCQAMQTTWVNDDQIKTLAEIPTWYVHCTNDPAVAIATTSEALYTRTVEAGATNIHFTKYESIVDPDYGNSYIGHFAWVYSLKNMCTTDYDGSNVTVDGTEVNLYQWLATCSK